MELFVYILKNYIIPAILLVLFILTFSLLSKRILYDYSKLKRQIIRRKSEVFLTSILLSNSDKKSLKKDIILFRNDIPFEKKWCKEMIIDDMIHLKKNIKGNIVKPLTLIYQMLKLNKYSADLIQNYRKHNITEGFYQYQSLDYKKGSLLIKPFLKFPNKVIRSNAIIAYISLMEGYPDSLDGITQKISDLNILKIMDIFHSKKIPLPQNINLWISSKNSSVVQLGLKIMSFYNYREQQNEIIELLNHPEEIIRKEAVITIRELFFVNAESRLVDQFYKESVSLQIEILTTLKIIGSDKSVWFLKNEITIQTHKDLKLKEVEILLYLDSDAINLIATTNLDTAKMLNHVREVIQC